VIGFVVRRLVQSVVILLALTLATFGLFHLLPGGETAALLPGRISKPVKDRFIHQLGLDRPLIDQYLHYLDRLVLHGDLGYSFKDNESVDAILAHDLPKSAILIGLSTLIALAIGLSAGLVQALRRNRIDDHLFTGFAFLLYATPDFFLGIVLIDLFALRFHWFPTEGPQGGAWTAPFTEFHAFVLPLVTATLTNIAVFSRYTRSSALDVLGQDFIRTARAKGASGWRVVTKHIVRNACIPIITLLGLSLPGLFGGAILIEEVFNYPGIGLESFNATVNRDYAVLLGITVLLGFLTIVGNLIADIAYAYADPRVRA
jgi:peptide/nickel transport system permease protein